MMNEAERFDRLLCVNVFFSGQEAKRVQAVFRRVDSRHPQRGSIAVSHSENAFRPSCFRGGERPMLERMVRAKLASDPDEHIKAEGIGPDDSSWVTVNVEIYTTHLRATALRNSSKAWVRRDWNVRAWQSVDL